MIITKLLSLGSGLTKSKALKIIFLLAEISILLYAIAEAEEEERNTIDLEDHN
ncbi:hypothetical protein N7U66_10290 [Lacinutrix neustonica]|uniref:Uncharacterized protein n=1 Tax=Lacinutrix neustonica TaxID=2980107 RepID=A0A9E8N0S4_9FLAO|nr:hypothetical protein [Lacinutrix neustonica]WAC03764.1 hypothetical protein N7U66_10290 [Lacinutrix neustonica]